ncbi:MAG: hypothetical protein V7K26_16775 [Nostoc sp.]|uniref:hypothetical protein n=1 Tax=Nostoc sp. TaxID=1180 RepID=UPI002FF01EED
MLLYERLRQRLRSVQVRNSIFNYELRITNYELRIILMSDFEGTGRRSQHNPKH